MVQKVKSMLAVNFAVGLHVGFAVNWCHILGRSRSVHDVSTADFTDLDQVPLICQRDVADVDLPFWWRPGHSTGEVGIPSTFRGLGVCQADKQRNDSGGTCNDFHSICSFGVLGVLVFGFWCLDQSSGIFTSDFSVVPNFKEYTEGVHREVHS